MMVLKLNLCKVPLIFSRLVSVWPDDGAGGEASKVFRKADHWGAEGGFGVREDR